MSSAVLSAVSGLQVKVALSQNAVVGITCGILVALFMMQRFGTARVGAAFAPIVIAWMLANAAIGIYK